jgi:hypothetical protein
LENNQPTAPRPRRLVTLDITRRVVTSRATAVERDVAARDAARKRCE